MFRTTTIHRPFFALAPDDPPAGDPPAGDPPNPPADPPKDPPAGDPPAGDPPDLGDAGKRALEAERRARRDAETARKNAESELAKVRKGQMSEQEKAIEEARADERRKGATRLLNASILASAAGKLQDPQDAVAFVASKVTIGDDGTFDEAAIASEIDELLKAKPYLGVAKGGATPPPGSANGGPQGNGGAAQWTEPDLDGKTPEQIEAARKAGLLNQLLGITT